MTGFASLVMMARPMPPPAPVSITTWFFKSLFIPTLRLLEVHIKSLRASPGLLLQRGLAYRMHADGTFTTRSIAPGLNTHRDMLRGHNAE